MSEDKFYDSFIEPVIDTLQEDIDQLSVGDQVIILEERLGEIIAPLKLLIIEDGIEYLRGKLFNSLKIPVTSL